MRVKRHFRHRSIRRTIGGSHQERPWPPRFQSSLRYFLTSLKLDFTGPAEVFARLPGAQLVLASTEGGELEADCGITFARVQRLADVNACSLLCVPGGHGTTAAMEDQAYLAAVRRLAAQAQYVTSVCTGSLLLAAAGLLHGKRATCHWAWLELLASFGAMAEQQRVVRDGKLITGGGVTAGMDMALAAMAEIAGDECAQIVQLEMEYARRPRSMRVRRIALRRRSLPPLVRASIHSEQGGMAQPGRPQQLLAVDSGAGLGRGPRRPQTGLDLQERSGEVLPYRSSHPIACVRPRKTTSSP